MIRLLAELKTMIRVEASPSTSNKTAQPNIKCRSVYGSSYATQPNSSKATLEWDGKEPIP